MSSVQEPADEQKTEEDIGGVDRDPQETSEWIEAFEQLRVYHGEERARFIVRELHKNALHNAVELPELVQTPYVNSIPVNEQAPFPGDLAIEKKSSIDTSHSTGICAQLEHFAQVRTFVRVRACTDRASIRDDLERTARGAGRERQQRIAARCFGQSDLAGWRAFGRCSG